MHRIGLNLALVAVFCGIFVAPAIASADTTVTVLGIRSVEGDDEFARNLTGALRHAADQVPEWGVSSAEVSLAQMSLAHGCDEPDAACMGDIAGDLDSQRIIYGTVRRTGAGDQYDFALTLYLFNSETGQIEQSLTDSIPRIASDIDDLRPRARRYVVRLAGQTQTGAIRVVVNLPGASVSIDGEEAGTADDDGVFSADEIAVGRHRVEIAAEGHQSFRASVTVVAEEAAELEVDLEAIATSGGSVPWIAIGTLAGAGVMAALTFWSWAKINSLSDDSDYDRYRNIVPANLNACTQARSGAAFGAAMDSTIQGAVDVCDQADVLEILQWVFLASAVAAGGVGTWLLLTHDSDDGAEDMALRIDSSFDRSSANISATLRF